MGFAVKGGGLKSSRLRLLFLAGICKMKCQSILYKSLREKLVGNICIESIQGKSLGTQNDVK